MLETLKSPLDNTDFMKLLFLFCKTQKKDFYSFFPYQYGCFSFEVYKDKRSLIEHGFLLNQDKFSVQKTMGMLQQIDMNDRLALIRFTKDIGGLRGQDLIRKTYIEYPEYAKRSEIKDKILSEQEQETLFGRESLFECEDKSIFTIGYEGNSIDDYLRRLIKSDIDIVVDVRSNPQSMKFDFNKKALSGFLSKIKVEYVGIPELGIPSDMRVELSDYDSYQKLFAIYDSEILPLQTASVAQIGTMIDAGKRVALTCFEKNHMMCHRYRIAQKISREHGYNIINL